MFLRDPFQVCNCCGQLQIAEFLHQPEFSEIIRNQAACMTNEGSVPVLQDASNIQVGFGILREILIGKQDFIPSWEGGLIKISWRYAGK
jgi:hypothetical protein